MLASASPHPHKTVLSVFKIIINLVLTRFILISISLVLVDLKIFLVHSLAIFPEEGCFTVDFKGKMKGRNSSRREQWGSTLNTVCFHSWRFLPFSAWEKEKLTKSSLGGRTAGVTSAMSQPEARKVNLPETQLWLHHSPTHSFISPTPVKRKSF